MDTFFTIVVAILVTEAITEIVSKSKIFEPLHEWFFTRREYRVFKFIHLLLDCPYCLSVWVGTLVGFSIVDIDIVSPYLDWFIVGILIHRSSNIIHNIIDRTRENDF